MQTLFRTEAEEAILAAVARSQISQNGISTPGTVKMDSRKAREVVRAFPWRRFVAVIAGLLKGGIESGERAAPGGLLGDQGDRAQGLVGAVEGV
jgi:hypothetical protein